MKVERRNQDVLIALDKTEVALLRQVLERALFIDTPPDQQASIASFATRLNEALPAS
jgi:hypothetical protein